MALFCGEEKIGQKPFSVILRLKKNKKVSTAIKLGGRGGGKALMARPLKEELFLRLPLLFIIKFFGFFFHLFQLRNFRIEVQIPLCPS